MLVGVGRDVQGVPLGLDVADLLAELVRGLLLLQVQGRVELLLPQHVQDKLGQPVRVDAGVHRGLLGVVAGEVCRYLPSIVILGVVVMLEQDVG